MVFKEMVIRRPRVNRMATLDLEGKWLAEIGFIAGALVSLVYQDSALILRISHKPFPNSSSILCVKSKMVRGRPRPHLTLDGFLLKRYGFHVGDRAVLQLSPNMIQITRVSHFTTAEV